MYNFNKAPVAYFTPATAAYRITVPAIISPTCLSCRRECEHGSTICGGCLDLLDGTAELRLPATKRCSGHAHAEAPTSQFDDHGPDTDEVRVVRPASPELDDQFDLVGDAGDVAASLCATCTDETAYRCTCGTLVCKSCCDDAGRCPRCEEV